jgi:hypothetical protein
MPVEVAELIIELPRLNVALLLSGVVSKFVPVIVTAVPGAAIVGVNEVIDGAPIDEPTTNGAPLVADPTGDVTAIGPVVAPAGTDATM